MAHAEPGVKNSQKLCHPELVSGSFELIEKTGYTTKRHKGNTKGHKAILHALEF